MFEFEYKVENVDSVFRDLLKEVNLVRVGTETIYFKCVDCKSKIEVKKEKSKVCVEIRNFKNCHDLDKVLKYANDSDNILLRIRETIIELSSVNEAEEIASEIESSKEMFLNKIAEKCKEIELLEISRDGYHDTYKKKYIYNIGIKLNATVEKRNIREVFDVIEKIRSFAESLHVANVI